MHYLMGAMLGLALTLSPLVTGAGERQAGGMFKASELIGKDIENRDGEDLGDVEDLLIDRNGKVTFAIVEAGAFLGVGGEYVPVPWSAVRRNQDGYYTLDITEERMGKAPSFGEEQWSRLNDPEYQLAVYDFYGVNPPDELRSQVASDVGGMKVRKTVKGEVLEIDRDMLVVRDRRGREITLHLDERSDFFKPIAEGDRIEAEITRDRHAQTIRKIR